MNKSDNTRLCLHTQTLHWFPLIKVKSLTGQWCSRESSWLVDVLPTCSMNCSKSIVFSPDSAVVSKWVKVTPLDVRRRICKPSASTIFDQLTASVFQDSSDSCVQRAQGGWFASCRRNSCKLLPNLEESLGLLPCASSGHFCWLSSADVHGLLQAFNIIRHWLLTSLYTMKHKVITGLNNIDSDDATSF